MVRNGWQDWGNLILSGARAKRTTEVVGETLFVRYPASRI